MTLRSRVLHRLVTTGTLLYAAAFVRVAMAEDLYTAGAAAGSDSGTDCADAHAATWFNASANWGVGAGKISPGDTVHLCGAIATPLVLQTSGSAGNIITVVFEPGATMSRDHWGGAAIQGDGLSYITIDGKGTGVIESTDNGTAGATNPKTGHPFAFQTDDVGVHASGASNFTIQNLTVNAMYVRDPGSTTDNNRLGGGVNLSGSNIRVQNNTLKEGDTMVGFSWSTGSTSKIVIDGNTIGRCNHGITVGSANAGSLLDDVVISNNRIDDLDVWTGVSGNHLDGMIIFNEGGSTTSITHLRIYGNNIGPHIANVNTAAVFLDGYAPTDYPGILVYNNIFTSAPNTSWSNGFIVGGSTGAVFANNTIVSSGGTIGVNSAWGTSVYNNLMEEIGLGVSLTTDAPDGGTTGHSDNNLFRFSGQVMMATKTGINFDFFYDFSKWQSTTGFDTHSIVADPQLIDVPGLDFHVKATSPAVGKGQNLSQYFTTDLAGGLRPATGAWTVGAYEYGAVPPAGDGGPDAGVAPDGGTMGAGGDGGSAAGDEGGPPGLDAGSGGGNGAGPGAASSSGACGCRTAGGRNHAWAGIAGMGLASMVAARRRRRASTHTYRTSRSQVMALRPIFGLVAAFAVAGFGCGGDNSVQGSGGALPDGGDASLSPDGGTQTDASGTDAMGPDVGGNPDAGRTQDGGRDSGPPPGKPIYVAENAAGSSDGSSCANAHPVTWFNDVKNWGAGMSQIGPATVVHLCGTFTGTAGGTMLAPPGSGSSGQPVTIYFDPGALLTAPYWQHAIDLSSTHYVTVDGGSNGTIENTANGTLLANQKGSMAISASNCSYCEIKNLTVQNIYVRTGNACEVDQTLVNAIRFGGADHVTIDNNVIHDVGWAILGSVDYETIAGNDIYNIDHGIQFGSQSSTLSGIVVHDNHIHDFALWDSTPQTDCYHHDGIHGFGGTSSVVTDFTAYNNLFDGQTGANFNQHIFLEGINDGTPWTSSPNSLQFVYNNVFFTSAPSESIAGLGSIGGNGVFVNNTVIGSNPTYTSACVGFGNSSTLTPGATVENNAVGGCGILVSSASPAGNFTVAAFDYNAYANCQNYNCFFTDYNGVSIDVSDFATWQTKSGFDAHSFANTASATYFNLDATYRPQTGSPLLGAGTNLSSLCATNSSLAALCKDKNGNPRPASGAWNIGAF